MESVPLAVRLVEVIASREEAGAERYRYGSGCIVRGRTVLTAAHVVAGAQRVQVRDPNKRLYSATMDPEFVGDANGPGPDLALVEIDDPGYAEDLPPIGLARVDRRSPRVQSVKECHAIGYPWFAETPSPMAMRDTVDAEGIVPTLSKLATGLLSVQVDHPPRPLPPEEKSLAESEWSGMSGGPVLAADRLLGVVTEHAPREGPSAIMAVPLTALEPDPAYPGWGRGVKDPSGWWARLGVSGLADLQRLPAPPERTPPASLGQRVVGDRVSPAVDGFQDHVEFCVRLRDLVLAREKPIICVTGRRGIGKSGVVAKVLADFEEPAEGADGRVGGLAYVSTRTDVGRINVGRITFAKIFHARIFHTLAELLPRDQQDHLEEQWANVPARADALKHLLTSLGTFNVVLVLDNLDDLQDPGTGRLTSKELADFLTSVCSAHKPLLVVTTSQRPIGLPDIRASITRLEIDDGLELNEAVEFLRELDADGEAELRDLPDAELRQAVERVHRMPRGLQLLAQLSSERKTDTLQRIFDAQDTPEVLLGRLVSEGFHSLDEVGQDVVRLLALADTPMPADALPDVLADKHPHDRVTRTVERLANFCMIGFERSTRRVRLHPIDSDYVRGTLLTDPGRRTALDLRLADWLATQRTDPLTWRTSTDVGPQRREIRHRLRAGDGAGAVQTMAGIAAFLARQGEADQLADVLEQGQKYIDTPGVRAAYELSRGSVASFVGSLDEAIDAFRAGREAAEEAGDRMLMAQLDLWLGLALRHAGDAAAALEPLERASKLPATDQTSREIVFRSIFQGGMAACYLGNLAKAEEAAARTEVMLREEDPSLWWARLADLRTLIALLQGDHTRVLAEVEKGIARYANSPSRHDTGYLMNVRGLVLLAQGRTKEAINEFMAVREDAADLHYTRLEGLATLNLAWAQLTEGNRVAAAVTASEAAGLLAANRVGETESAQALAAACEAAKADTMLDGLRLAVSASRHNPDLYQPSDQVMAGLAAGGVGH